LAIVSSVGILDLWLFYIFVCVVDVFDDLLVFFTFGFLVFSTDSLGLLASFNLEYVFVAGMVGDESAVTAVSPNSIRLLCLFIFLCFLFCHKAFFGVGQR
jgi:hypothetical protein